MSFWSKVLGRKASDEHNKPPPGASRHVAILLVLLSVFGEPSLWNSEALAQESQNLRIHFFESNHNAIKQNITSQGTDVRPEILFTGNYLRLNAPTHNLGAAGPIGVSILAMAQRNSVALSAAQAAQATDQTSGGSSSSVQKKSRKLVWILVAVAGGVVAAALVMRKSSDGSGSGGNTPIVTVGPPVVGPPQ